MRFERSWTGNWENAFHGLRHPMESYAKGDTGWYDDTPTNEWKCGNQAIEINASEGKFLGIGPNDIDLAQRMIKAGSPNDKFLRQIFVSVDITGPLYWWKEMDTYKVGTTANSTSTMHKLATTPITIDCFETDDFDPDVEIESYNFESDEDSFTCSFGYTSEEMAVNIIEDLEKLRQKYLETKDKRYWKELIRWLPEGWNQTRTWTADYAVLRNIIHWRSGHKLSEWAQFIDWCHTLPYADQLLFYHQTFVI